MSLNAPDAEEYEALCRPQAEHAFEHMLRFAENAARFAKVYMTIIDTMSPEGRPPVFGSQRNAAQRLKYATTCGEMMRR